MIVVDTSALIAIALEEPEAEACSKILEAEAEHKVTVRIVPFEAGAHAAQDSNFVLLEFAGPSLSPVVYVEGLTGSRYIDRQADVDRYRETVEQLGESALNSHDSMHRLNELRQAFSGS